MSSITLSSGEIRHRGLSSRSWVEIDVTRLRSNIHAVRRSLSSRAELIFVVKANAYGHGAVRLAEEAAHAGVRWFAVAYLEEAIALRAALPDVQLLILGVVAAEDVKQLVDLRIVPVVVSVDHGLALGAEAVKQGVKLSVHVKVDTGMARLGLTSEEVATRGQDLTQHEGLDMIGVCSHFATVDLNDPEKAAVQHQSFHKAATQFELWLDKPLFKHMSSSRAALVFRGWDYSAIRTGIVLYGYGASEGEGDFSTQPILEWRTNVVQLKKVPAGAEVGYYGTHTTDRDTCLAVLAVGYADGYLRTLSNRGEVLIRGRRYPVVGRVSMNWITVDVGPDPEVEVGDVVTLIGRQGDEMIWANELAEICRTIPYEILTNIDASLERRYVDPSS